MTKIIFISIMAVGFLYSTIHAAVSDSFLSNAPMIIGAITVFIAGLVAGFVKIFNTIKAYHTEVNHKMDLLLKEKDDKIKAVETAKVLADAIVAARNQGKLDAIEEQKKEELLKQLPPEKA